MSYKEGDLVEVYWRDAAGFINERRSKAVAAHAVNVGKVVVMSKMSITLETGIYTDDGDDPVGDYTVIPRGWITKVRVIEEKK